jgi:hypothetical protein
MQTLSFDEFMRSLKQNMDTPHSMLLGAGASVESDIPSASDCIWEWKREIFLSQNPTMIEKYSNIKVDNIRIVIQKWFDEQQSFPASGSKEEYSFYAEKALPIQDDRRKYFQHLVDGKKPSLGYHLISMLAEIGWIKSIWTTNFDGLMIKCAHSYNLKPIEVTSDTAERVYRDGTARELLCVALHGDYKYGILKNTTSELDLQNDIFIDALSHELSNRHLVVIGYSGRDKSLMAALKKAYQVKGSGRLYWCGYGQDINEDISNLIENINKMGRTAFFIAADGFDNTLYSIARHCLSDNQAILTKIEGLKQRLGNCTDIGITKFKTINSTINKIVELNAFPISFPKMCYQFQVK